METIEKIIKMHPFLEGLDEKYVSVLSSFAKMEKFQEGQAIFKEWEEAKYFYLITRGKVDIEAYVPGPEAFTVQSLESGDVLGWSWLFPPYRWHFSAIAKQPTDIISIDAPAFRSICDEDKEFGVKLYKRISYVIIKRLQATRLRRIDQIKEELEK